MRGPKQGAMLLILRLKKKAKKAALEAGQGKDRILLSETPDGE